MPTNHFTFCSEHKNSPQSHFMLPLQDSSASRHWYFRGTALPCFPTGWSLPQTSSRALDIYDSSCKGFDSHPGFPLAVLPWAALPGQRGLLHTQPDITQPARALLCRPASWMAKGWVCWPTLRYSHKKFTQLTAAPKSN